MKSKCTVVILIASLVLGVLPLHFVQVFCQPVVDGYASGDNPHVNTIEKLACEGWKLVVNDTIAHDHDFSTTDDANDDFWMSVWEACDDAGNVYLAFLSNYQLFGVAVWLDFDNDGVFTIGSEPSPLLVSLDTPDFPCLYNFTMGIGYTDPIAGAHVSYSFDNTFIEIMVPRVEMEGDVNETVWDCMSWNYMVGVDADADENFSLPPDWIATGWGSWCTFTDNREHEMWNGTHWVPLQSWFACPCQPSEICQITFLTQPAEDGFSINFLGTTYNDGDTDIFIYGTSGVITTNCPEGWVFDHWEVIGNISVSDSTENPAQVNITSSGNIKAVFFPAMCQVTFLTEPASSSFNITFKSKTYHNGTTDILGCGNSDLVTANCSDGWKFDHWETTGYLQVSNTTENPTTLTINCGSIKAVFKPSQCQVTFYTEPACNYYYINFQCKNYHNGTTDTFAFGTSGLATANCPDGWIFDHWEITGNIQISSTTTNPANITICCGGTVKAIFKRPQCQVTFYTSPVCNYYYITFQCKNYHNGTTDTFAYGTSGLATASCPDGWVFDHWEATGNVQVSNATENPTTITICCGGTLKAVFRPAQKPPNADFTWCPATPKPCETVTFNASASTPNGGVIVSYKWDFGDGNITIVDYPILTHHYGSAGNYTVVLNVTDSEGKWDTETKIIKVVQNPKACCTNMHHSLTVTFNASSSYDPDGYIISYKWDFGDGNITTVVFPVINHTYAKPGTYNVTLTVTDNDGLSASVEDSLTIKAFLGDINDDGKIDVRDIYIVAKAFGTKPGDQNWNSIADINNDGKVGIEDLYIIAKDFGKTL